MFLLFVFSREKRTETREERRVKREERRERREKREGIRENKEERREKRDERRSRREKRDKREEKREKREERREKREERRELGVQVEWLIVFFFCFFFVALASLGCFYVVSSCVLVFCSFLARSFPLLVLSLVSFNWHLGLSLGFFVRPLCLSVCFFLFCVLMYRSCSSVSWLKVSPSR